MFGYRKNTTFVPVFMDKGIYNRLLFSSQLAGQDKTTFIENAVIMYAEYCDKLNIKTEEFLEEIKCPEEVPVEKTEERIKEEYEKVLSLLREAKVDNKYKLAMFEVRNDLTKICPCLVEENVRIGWEYINGFEKNIYYRLLYDLGIRKTDEEIDREVHKAIDELLSRGEKVTINNICSVSGVFKYKISSTKSYIEYRKSLKKTR